jgi:hypothetical protein
VNANRDNSAVLQAFLNTSEQPRRYGSAFTRQRTLVRTQHRPLRKNTRLQEKYKREAKSKDPSALFLHQ